jgi:hypothetical protein
VKLSKGETVFLSICAATLAIGILIPSISTGSKSEDFRACSDAGDAQGSYVSQYVNTEESQRFWVQSAFAKELRDISARNISSDLADRLVEDSIRIDKSKKFLPIMESMNEFCMANFDKDW